VYSPVIGSQISLLRRGLPQSRPGKNIPAARGGWEEEKLKRAGNRSPRSRFLSPALPLPFLSLVFTNRSLCGGESSRIVLRDGESSKENAKIRYTDPSLLSPHGLNFRIRFIHSPFPLSAGSLEQASYEEVRFLIVLLILLA